MKIDQMNDPYEKEWESIGKALLAQSKIILWVAERTAKDFKEFVDEFAKKEDNHDKSTIADLTKE